MSEIDWSKAPEDATHARYIAGNTPDFYKAENGNLVYWDEHDLAWASCSWRDIHDYDIVARHVDEWNGERLPPVGTVCEAYWPNDTEPRWYEFRLLFVSDKHVIADINGTERHYASGDFDNCKVQFRPIRTPEKIAAEERAKSIEEIYQMISGQMGHLNVRELATEIYEAGFRKQGEQS